MNQMATNLFGFFQKRFSGVDVNDFNRVVRARLTGLKVREDLESLSSSSVHDLILLFKQIDDKKLREWIAGLDPQEDFFLMSDGFLFRVFQAKRNAKNKELNQS